MQQPILSSPHKRHAASSSVEAQSSRRDKLCSGVLREEGVQVAGFWDV